LRQLGSPKPAAKDNRREHSDQLRGDECDDAGRRMRSPDERSDIRERGLSPSIVPATCCGDRPELPRKKVFTRVGFPFP
jgi:hypothetical protein